MASRCRALCTGSGSFADEFGKWTSGSDGDQNMPKPAYVHTAWTSRRLGAFRETMSLTIILEQSFRSAVTSISSDHPHVPIGPCPGRVSWDCVTCLQLLCVSSRRHNLGGICTHLTDATVSVRQLVMVTSWTPPPPQQQNFNAS
jgi:hypothetical protein